VTTAARFQKIKNTARDIDSRNRSQGALSFYTDETIIGGLVARIGSTIFDGSVQTISSG
jgi:F0F1-type ATP synthase delta subunit